MKFIHILAALLLMFSVTACEADNGVGPKGNESLGALDPEMLKQTIDTYPVYDLDQSEIDGLVLMREEEKLARDVYLHFADTYSLRAFDNIAQSEARHMAAIKALLDKYGIEDPVKDDTRGVFTNDHLRDLYAQLTAKGDASLLDALLVGATIEDLDIKDLMDLSASLDKEDILFVYGNLIRGSENHLRAFHSQIVANGGRYQPQYISQETFDSILASSNGRGRGRR